MYTRSAAVVTANDAATDSVLLKDITVTDWPIVIAENGVVDFPPQTEALRAACTVPLASALLIRISARPACVYLKSVLPGHAAEQMQAVEKRKRQVP